MIKISDLDECVMESHMCGPNGRCENRKGSYNCRCNSGYRAEQYGLIDKKCTGKIIINFILFSRTKIIDINECKSSANCQYNCINTQGSFKCTCPPGYSTYANKCQGYKTHKNI